MYEVKEYFSEDNNINLKEILKCTIYKYYLKRKNNINNSLQDNGNNDILNVTSKDALSRKEIINV